MTTWPTAATSDVAPGSSPASSSETPSAAAVATTPATAAGQSRPAWRVGRRGRLRDAFDGGAHGCIIGVRCDIRVSRVSGSASSLRPSAPRPVRRAARRRSAGRMPGSGLVAQDVVERPGRDDLPVGQHERVREPGRDLLDVVRDEHDGRRSRLAGERAPGRARASRGRPRSRLAAGSSRSSRSGSGISARAIDVRRRSPADSVP